MLRKLLLSLGLVLLLLVVSAGIYLSSGPEFPASTDAIIKQHIAVEPPQLVLGQSGVVKSSGVDIWYERLEPSKAEFATARGTVLLIMGAGASSMLWTPDWLQAFTGKGYRVIRFDNRGTGMSDWMANWNSQQAYSLETMAKDALAVLDANGVKQAHVLGVSMGGMIAQRLAIGHADRVLSLVSMSTSAYMFDPDMPEAGIGLGLQMLRLIVKYAMTGTETGMTKMWLGIVDLMRSDSLNDEDVRSVTGLVTFEMRKRRGFNREAMPQHMAAMKLSGSRLDEMKKISCPVLVIHGTADTSVDIAHARKYAPLIPNARTLWLEGEGHLFSKSKKAEILQAVFGLIGG